MSTRNFYNAMTPGSHIGAEVMLGKSAYKEIADSELNSKYVKTANMMPGGHGGNLLNKINEHGLLTYADFHFLLLLMSTSTRYLDIIFHGFDISADGSVEAKEFVHVLARVANVKKDPDELMKSASKSGLVRYLFKDDLSGELTKDDFIKLQSDLITDVLEMEFTRYTSDIEHKISETDFCRHLLYSSSISQKKKEKMIKMVETEFAGKSTGISFDSFRTFYKVLFGGAELERAMFFLDSENQGVTRDEFANIANWVVGCEVDPLVIEVVYCLLDEDGDRNLSTKEFNPVLFSWRHSRGFQNGALSVTLGNMKF
jgi:Ca2+-binding EF-hand superfamily protein